MAATDVQPAEPLGEVAALEPLPEDRTERLDTLREISKTNAVGYGLCPECGQDLATTDARLHARQHWGSDPNGIGLSVEAKQRYAYVLRLADQQAQGR